MKRLWQFLRDWLGFNIPPEVAPNMPKSLDEYRERKRRGELA